MAQAAPAPAKADSNDPVERARVHYERGLVLFNEENYDAALFEFERAYELAPSYKILYNMGRIQRQQNNYAAAMRSYQRYLKEGANEIPADRKAEVEREITILTPRVARITVKVNVDDADVYADDIPVCTATIETACVGKSPLKSPIVVNGGRHKITATKKGYATATSLVSVVGDDAVEVKLDLVDLSRPAAPPSNPWTVPTVIGWSATGAALVATTVFGILSLGAKNDQDDLLKKQGATRSQLADARSKTETLSGVTDALWITTAVFAGASAYLTIKMVGFNPGEKKEKEKAPTTASSLSVRVGPTGFAGTF